MKISAFVLACLACLASSAIANPPKYEHDNAAAEVGIAGVTGVLDAAQHSDVPLPAKGVTQTLTQFLAPTGEAGNDGELHFTGSFATKSQTSGLFPTTGFTRTTFNVTLKVVNGKVVGAVATEEVRHASGPNDDIRHTEMLADAAPPTTTKSWGFGPADFLAEHRGGNPRTDAKKAPSSIASETQQKPNNSNLSGPSPKQQLAVTCNTVSPSSPGCP